MTRSTRMMIAVVITSMLAAVVCAQDALDSGGVRTVVKRGLTGEIMFTYEGPALQADPHQDLSAPMLLRLERSERDPTIYTARFIGSIKGDYDLRSLIVHVDGSAADDVRPIMVHVVSELPAGMETDLFDAADLDVQLDRGYVRTAIMIGLVWLLIPVIVIVRRLMRRKTVVEAAVGPAPPTLAEQLRPLVEALANRQLSVREEGRLELLLYHYWQERLQPRPADMAECIRQIREHPEAGELLRMVEGWLHRPEGHAHKPERLDDLLEPYRTAPAIAEHELSAHGSVVTT